MVLTFEWRIHLCSRYSYTCTLHTGSSLDAGLGITGGVGGALLLIILVMAVLLILLTVHIRKSGSQDISTATTTGEALDTCASYALATLMASEI